MVDPAARTTSHVTSFLPAQSYKSPQNQSCVNQSIPPGSLHPCCLPGHVPINRRYMFPGWPACATGSAGRSRATTSSSCPYRRPQIPKEIGYQSFILH